MRPSGMYVNLMLVLKKSKSLTSALQTHQIISLESAREQQTLKKDPALKSQPV